MSSTQTPAERAEANSEKQRVAISSLAAALVLVLMKTTVGLLTNSIGILAEAAHSALDLVAAGVTVWAVSISGQPADGEHTYGHGKFENLSALFETALLLATCVWIVFEVAARLFLGKEDHVDANFWAFAVMAVSIAVDISRSRALRRAAEKHKSQALEADALHFSTDVWSSSVVLLGLVGVLVAGQFNMPWLMKADAVAALGVALIVVWVSLKLGRKSVDDLLDRVPKDFPEKVSVAAAGVSGVVEVKKVRVRKSGADVFADVTITVDHSAPLDGAHSIADEAEQAVQDVLPGADVVVHVEPVAPDHEEATTTVRRVAARHGLGAHGIRIYDQRGRRSLELHLEVDQSLNIEDAHQQATEFELALREELPGLEGIVTHIEPAGDEACTLRAEQAGQSLVVEALGLFADADCLPFEPHDVKVQMVDGELAVSFHCSLDAATAITEAHQLTERLESYLRSRIDNLGRVVIHVEPEDGGE